MGFGSLLFVCLMTPALADDEIYRLDASIQPPQPFRKVNPAYSGEARAAHIQGTVMLEAVVERDGSPSGLRVVSPLGYGLDEQAQAALRLWRFRPALRDGQPVRSRTTVEMNFRLPGRWWFDQKRERQRTAFNVALADLNHGDPKSRAAAVATMQRLAAEKYPAAMHILGTLYRSGNGVERDRARAVALFQAAAAKRHGPALFELAVMQWRTDPTSRNTKGLEMLRNASVRGSAQAQLMLGQLHERGTGVPQETESARRYYRLCAARGMAACQYRLARLLLQPTDRSEHDYLQAVAWAELAADQGGYDARQLVEAERLRLSPDQITWVSRLKTRLGQRR